MKINDFVIIGRLHNAVCKIVKELPNGNFMVDFLGKHQEIAPEDITRVAISY